MLKCQIGLDLESSRFDQGFESKDYSNVCLVKGGYSFMISPIPPFLKRYSSATDQQLMNYGSNIVSQ